MIKVLDSVQFSVVIYPHHPEVSEKDDARLPQAGSRSRFQLQHATLTADKLRGATHAWWTGSADREQVRLWRELRGDMLAEWMRHKGEDESEIVDSWLGGGDFEAVAESLDVKRRTAFTWVGQFLRASSYIYWKQDAQVHCDESHRSAGGDGRTPPIGRREHSAGSCPTCSILRLATWDGWIVLGVGKAKVDGASDGANPTKSDTLGTDSQTADAPGSREDSRARQVDR
jgi:hypothetical protein